MLVCALHKYPDYTYTYYAVEHDRPTVLNDLSLLFGSDKMTDQVPTVIMSIVYPYCAQGIA